MLEEAIVAAKAGDAGLERRAGDFSPQITVDAPIMLPEDYVPDLDLRMGLYRRMNELENRQDIESFAAELIDRFGKVPAQTENLIKVIERSEERRVGQESVSQCRYRWSPDH